MHNGSRIFYREEFVKKVATHSHGKKTSKPKEAVVDKFMAQFSIKGPTPDFIIKALRNTRQYKEWMLCL